MNGPRWWIQGLPEDRIDPPCENENDDCPEPEGEPSLRPRTGQSGGMAGQLEDRGPSSRSMALREGHHAADPQASARRGNLPIMTRGHQFLPNCGQLAVVDGQQTCWWCGKPESEHGEPRAGSPRAVRIRGGPGAMVRPLERCGVCSGHGWIFGGPRSTNGRQQCPHCHGTGWEPAPKDITPRQGGSLLRLDRGCSPIDGSAILPPLGVGSGPAMQRFVDWVLEARRKMAVQDKDEHA